MIFGRALDVSVPPPNPYLDGMSPYQHVYQTLKSVRSSDMEEVRINSMVAANGSEQPQTFSAFVGVVDSTIRLRHPSIEISRALY